MIARTPQPISRRMSAASFTVHTCTGRPAFDTARTNRGETTRVKPFTSGTWKIRYFVRPGDRLQIRTIECPPHFRRAGAGHDLGRLRASASLPHGNAPIEMALKPPMITRDAAPASRITAAVRRASSADSPFTSTMNGRLGKQIEHFAESDDADAAIAIWEGRRIGEAISRVNVPQVSDGERRHGAATIGLYAIERGVVNDDGLAVLSRAGRQVRSHPRRARRRDRKRRACFPV